LFIFEIIIPGTWLDYDDREWTWKIERQLDSLQSQFFEANLALNLFLSAQKKNILNKERVIGIVIMRSI